MKVIATAILLFFASASWAGAVDIRGVRLWAAPDNTRVVLDISGPIEHVLNLIGDPDRVVIDISNARLAASLPPVDRRNGVLADIRFGPRNSTDLRMVLDLQGRVRPKSFLLKPNDQYGHRLVIDLERADERPVAVSAPVKQAAEQQGRELVIAIDAGHGGEDPGARGHRGTNEKDVVLAISRKLATLVAKEPGMRPVLIRDGDYYVGLRQRMVLARKHKADLFVSIHADAFKDRRASGSSVFALSERGASSEAARWLAERENAADLVGGVSLDDKDDLLKTVLLDLSQNATMEASLNVADRILDGLSTVGRTHKSRVQQAGFMVLKSPDIPSVLVETAFISNPEEERKLRDPHQQQKLARAIMSGIRAYFAQHAPAGTLLAAREHIIGPGDTLSGIAKQYQVSLDRLRAANGLKTNVIRIGQVLRIPGDSDG